VEMGLASALSMFFGITAALYGMAMLGDDAFPNWAAALAIVGGIGTTISGVVMAYTGFSDVEMLISMPANLVLLLWTLTIGLLMWRVH
jgi:hypothetical protein